MSNHTLSNSPKNHHVRNITGNHSISKDNLPKLSHQAMRGNNSPNLINKRKNKYKGGMLRIEGNSKIL